MKPSKFLIFSMILVLFLIPNTSSNMSHNATRPECDNTIASLDANQFKAVGDLSSGYASFSEAGDYTNTWIEDASYYHTSAQFALYTKLMMQLPDLSDVEMLVFHVDWRGTASVSNNINWALGDANGNIIGAHNSIYKYTGTDTGYETRSVELIVDTDVLNAQNATGHLSFIITASGVYTYNIWVDWACIEIGYEYDFRESSINDAYITPDPSQFKAQGNLSSGYASFSEAGDYTNTWFEDASYYHTSAQFALYTKLIMQLPDLAKFDVMVFHVDWRGTASVSNNINWALGDANGNIIGAHNSIYTYTGTDTGYETRSVELIVDTDVLNAQNATGHLSFIITASGVYTYNIWVDWACIEIYRNDTGYVESFADVTDWTVYSGGAISTDTDIATIECIGTSSPDYEGAYTNHISFDNVENHYVEVRYRGVQNAGTVDWARIRLYEADDYTTLLYTISLTINDEWHTFKGLLPNGTVESYLAYCQLDNAVDLDIQIDYFRIVPSDEMGWGHDCSTTQGFTNATNMDISTNAGLITLTANAGDYGSIILHPDNTSTTTDIEPDYYPFCKLKIDAVTSATGWALKAYYSDSTNTTLQSYTTTTGMHYYNILANAGTATVDCFELLVYNDGGSSAVIDWIKGAYTIANFTVTQSSTTVDDIIYVDNGILNSVMDSGYFLLEYDPLYQNITDTLQWNKSTALGNSYISFYYDSGFTDYYGTTSGSLYGGTLTGLRIKLNDTADIIQITYSSLPPQWNVYPTVIVEFDLPEWVILPAVIVWIFVEFSQTTIDYILMFAGLILIPVATMYLVKGGRDEMSTDKILIFLLVFFAGVGLFLGGLLI